MKFLKFRLMNEASETGESGGASESVAETSADNYANEYSSQNAIGEDDESVFKSFGLDASKYGLDEKSESEAPIEESKGLEGNQKEAGQAIDEKSFLDRLNSLGAVHNELPVEVKSIEEVKNALQMFKDYTVKTQTLSDERKGWEAEKTETEKTLNSAIDEFNNAQKAYGQQLQELEQWTFALKELEQTAPDIFEEVQRAYQGTVKQFSNPVLDKQLESIRAELAETKKALSSREDKLIVDSFESEYAKMSATEQSFKELGINVNKDEVKKKWAATGLPVEEAIGALYGKLVMQAQASKAKVETVKKVTGNKPVGVGSQSRSGEKVKAIDSKLKAGSLKFASAIWDKHTA